MIKIDVRGDKAYIFTPYSDQFVKKVKMIGGAKWNGKEKCWVIPADAVDTCRGFMEEVYGETDIPDAGERVKLRVTFLIDYEEYCAPIQFFGRVLASARGRDSGAVPGDGVVFKEGAPRSGGSAKNWTTKIPKGAVLIVSSVPMKAYEKDKDAETRWRDKIFEVEILNGDVDHAKLKAEREALAARIAEIDKLLQM